MKTSGRDELKRRIGPGIWIDQDDNVHWSIKEIFDLFEIEDTPENRKAAVQILEKIIQKSLPDTKSVFRETKGQTYGISLDGKSITCLICGKTSFHPGDVQHCYCSNCNKFHEQPVRTNPGLSPD